MFVDLEKRDGTTISVSVDAIHYVRDDDTGRAVVYLGSGLLHCEDPRCRVMLLIRSAKAISLASAMEDISQQFASLTSIGTSLGTNRQ